MAKKGKIKINVHWQNVCGERYELRANACILSEGVNVCVDCFGLSVCKEMSC